MTRKRRDLDAERRDLTAAAERLLAGTPMRSASGKLTSTELITESGLRRDVVYRNHKDLVDDFKAASKPSKPHPARSQESPTRTARSRTKRLPSGSGSPKNARPPRR